MENKEFNNQLTVVEVIAFSAFEVSPVIVIGEELGPAPLLANAEVRVEGHEAACDEAACADGHSKKTEHLKITLIGTIIHDHTRAYKIKHFFISTLDFSP